MDIVLPLGTGSYHNNIELRYCLRSIETYYPHENIFIIGECPGWLQNVIHIPFKETPNSKFKERNIKDKVLAACADPRVSDDFMYWNDDHYLVKPYKDFPYYHSNDFIWEGVHGQTVLNTHRILNQPRNFDVHCPIMFNKDKFIRSMDADWSKPYGYLMKTLYCERNGITGQTIPDCKIRHVLKAEEIKDRIFGNGEFTRPWFSIGDKSFRGAMKQVLEELYPNKSSYERD